LKFLLDHNINGVLFLTGDRHFTTLLKTERPNSYPLYELTCSPLTAGVPSNLQKERENPLLLPNTFVDQRNFCTLDFSGKKDERKITVRSFSTEGKQLWEKELSVAEITKK
jgi:alkaline phosphatase D